MTTTPEQRTKLKAAAEAATPGPWDFRTLENFGGNVVRYRNGDRFDIARIAKAGLEANAAFIAAANPETILALLSEIESLEARVASAEGAWPQIKTAPEGEDLLLCAADPWGDGKSAYGVGSVTHWAEGAGSDWQWAFSPTHWRPLPEPPARAHFQSQGGEDA